MSRVGCFRFWESWSLGGRGRISETPKIPESAAGTSAFSRVRIPRRVFGDNNGLPESVPFIFGQSWGALLIIAFRRESPPWARWSHAESRGTQSLCARFGSEISQVFPKSLLVFPAVVPSTGGSYWPAALGSNRCPEWVASASGSLGVWEAGGRVSETPKLPESAAGKSAFSRAPIGAAWSVRFALRRAAWVFRLARVRQVSPRCVLRP